MKEEYFTSIVVVIIFLQVMKILFHFQFTVQVDLCWVYNCSFYSFKSNLDPTSHNTNQGVQIKRHRYSCWLEWAMKREGFQSRQNCKIK